MTTNIDARGLACPQPVLMAKQAVDTDRPSRLNVQVDNEAAVENVSRFLGTRGYETMSTGQDGSFTVSGVDTSNSGKEDNAADSIETRAKVPDSDHGEETRKILVLITSDRMGSGDDDLGRKLMISFIKPWLKWEMNCGGWYLSTMVSS